jgi:hypothetical protein
LAVWKNKKEVFMSYYSYFMFNIKSGTKVDVEKVKKVEEFLRMRKTQVGFME